MVYFKAWDAGKDAGPTTELAGEYTTARLEKYLRILEIANGQHTRIGNENVVNTGGELC